MAAYLRYARNSYEVVAYTFEADIHCPDCTREAYPQCEGVDSEGNDVHPVFLDQVEGPEICGDCGTVID